MAGFHWRVTVIEIVKRPLGGPQRPHLLVGTTGQQFHVLSWWMLDHLTHSSQSFTVVQRWFRWRKDVVYAQGHRCHRRCPFQSRNIYPHIRLIAESFETLKPRTVFNFQKHSPGVDYVYQKSWFDLLQFKCYFNCSYGLWLQSFWSLEN